MRSYREQDAIFSATFHYLRLDFMQKKIVVRLIYPSAELYRPGGFTVPSNFLAQKITVFIPNL